LHGSLRLTIDVGNGVGYNRFNTTRAIKEAKMKTTNLIALMSGFLVFIIFGACTPLAPAKLSDEDFDATVSAMVEATNTAEANLAATVNAAVEATQAVEVGLTAAADAAAEATKAAEADLAAAVDAAVEATSAAEAGLTATASAVTQEQPTAAPTEAPPPAPTVDTSTLSEEDLAALIDEAVAEAVAATEEATTAMDTAASDGTVTYEETVNVEVVLSGAEEAVALAEELIMAYYSIYGAYYSETLYILEEMEEDLNTIAEAFELMMQILEQGGEITSVVIEQILAALEAADVSAAEIQAQSEGWLEALQAELENRAADALAVQATEIATDRQGAIQSVLQYADTTRSSLADGIISQEELSAIALSGANASASLKAQGGPQLQNLTGSIDALTAQIARGELPQAKGSLGALEASVPGR
jgi:hypothetical protein